LVAEARFWLDPWMEATGTETASMVAAAAELVGRGLSELVALGGSTRSTVLRARTAAGWRVEHLPLYPAFRGGRRAAAG
jgi:hypothetical protein